MYTLEERLASSTLPILKKDVRRLLTYIEQLEKIIAAAPDLLAALESIEADANYAKDSPRDQTDRLFDILFTSRKAMKAAAAMTEARAAIAAAKKGNSHA